MDGKVHKPNKKSVNHNTLNSTTDEDQKAKLNDIRDGFNFPIVNFPFISSNSTTTTEYIFNISKLKTFC